MYLLRKAEERTETHTSRDAQNVFRRSRNRVRNRHLKFPAKHNLSLSSELYIYTHTHIQHTHTHIYIDTIDTQIYTQTKRSAEIKFLQIHNLCDMTSLHEIIHMPH